MHIVLIMLLVFLPNNSMASSCNTYLVHWANLHNSGKIKEAQMLFKTIQHKCINGDNNGKSTTKNGTRSTKRRHSQ